MRKFLLTFFALLFIAGCGDDGKQTVGRVKFEPFKTGEEIALKSVNGKPVTLIRKEKGFVIKGDEGKVLMLDIFGTFCPPCQKEAHEIMQYQLDNIENFMIIGLTHFENVTDEYVVSDFMQKYNAFYYITNDQKINDRLAEQIVLDIGYQREIALPFKVVLKNGEYQNLTDVDSGAFGVKYYLGGIKMPNMKSDLQKIYEMK
ncbi:MULTISPECIES: TlpA family protein disulfide reductase [unclassified Campylobacter]|uniref:TlpA family protein disulfide reductase n=1 Tax=unclassified Campylobacter TaxID=2593542 RepID=UPI003D342A79